MRLRLLPWFGAALLAALGCGGGGSAAARSTTPATVLVYQPAASPTWRLELDPASASAGSSHLVLDLMAPAGLSGQGFTVVLGTDPGNAVWSRTGGSYALQNLFPNPAVGIASLSPSGADLRIVFGQAPGAPVSYDGRPVLQVALDLAPGATVGGVTLTASQAGNLAGPTPDLVTVAVGGLSAQ